MGGILTGAPRPGGPGAVARVEERTRAAALRYLAALNRHDADAVAACVAENFVNEHVSSMGRDVVGREAYRERLDGFLADFADLKYVMDDLVIRDVRAVLAYTMSFRLVPAGHAPVRVRGVFRLWVDADGLIARRIDYWDGSEVRRQLAAASSSASSAGSGTSAV